MATSLSVSAAGSTATASKGTRLRLLVISQGETAIPALAELTDRGLIEPCFVDSFEEGACRESLPTADAVLAVAPEGIGHAALAAGLRCLAESLASHRLGAVLITDRPQDARRDEQGLIATVPWAVTADELWGRLQTITHYRPILAQMERQLDNMQRLGKRLNRDFKELDQEMRLASRLQREFLPSHLPTLGRTQFATVFRPATWVSGDIFDVYRVDETHVAFYIADAVGHGVAAGLLTMVIKQGIESKRIRGAEYELLTPSETMTQLNAALVEQHLPHSQFVTACYGLLNTQTLELQFARGGHPHPLHITTDGAIHEVKVEGGLLGLFENEEFPNMTIQLRRGDKFVLFSDGVEAALVENHEHETGLPVFTETLLGAAHLPVEDFAAHVTNQLDATEGSLNPEDDITLVALEILPE
ncbi:MAG: serine/threonine-protein phosphatase [Phycisphaerae bacterium]|nr:serine/threonine-protein phosphatase [Phycisphaerae bacterium]